MSSFTKLVTDGSDYGLDCSSFAFFVELSVQLDECNEYAL